MSLMSYNAAGGLSGLLKQGSRNMSSQEMDSSPYSGAVTLRNIEACQQLSQLLSTSLGPQGRCKLVVNHLEKIIVTSDAAAILKEIDIQHPASNMIATACKQQAQEYGDATNLVVSLAGSILTETATLIHKMTWQPASEIILGYQRGLDIIKEELENNMICDTIDNNVNNLTVQDLQKVLLPVLQTQHYGAASTLAPLVSKACLQIYRSNNSFDADSIRTVKLHGSNIEQCKLVSGWVATRGVETTTVTSVKNAKVAVYACGIEASTTEAKGTVLLKSAQELQTYHHSEQEKMNDIIKGLKEANVSVVVTGGVISDMALHFLNANEILAFKIGSKWELRRLCRAVGATALVRLGTPTPDEMGYATSVTQSILGDGKKITIVENETSTEASALATIVLRASTNSTLQDLERAVDAGVQAAQQVIAKDGRLVPGAGATEMALSVKLNQAAASAPGLQPYALQALSRALLIVPQTLAQNAGWNVAQVLADWQAVHQQNEKCTVGINVENDEETADLPGGLLDSVKAGIVDVMRTKLSAMQLAIDVAVTILKIDQLIMSKPAGGPKMG